ncbi:hypothetical protein [Mameliella alba]|uniref:Resolvase helix-turn-helix domain protein n=1 Tax=Mameliella alba TaxID=561184 RepID=A0A0B3RWX0_9RHOB|nr:hypothetical protein [Mameliella alba]KHQ51243.1 Resolvase helix-turn-helix domain protein [Mameliella alba]MBY6121824.1 hypothetical protein [Mameliella alba]OWV40397.1 hypothetical protein CDZ95_21455 [Mameliella alba]
MSDEKPTRDLFGELTVMPSGRRGRPAHQRSQSAANRVILGCAVGLSVEEIAKGLGVSEPTLRKHYFSELKMRDMHRTRLDLARLETLATQALAGNVGADRQLQKMVEQFDRRRQAREIEGKPAAAPAEKLGKKAAARKAAETALQDGWGGDLQPDNWH